MLILEVLIEKGELRFTRLGELVEGISQKMLMQTLRQMERDGLITRTAHPIVPPKVHKLTKLGMNLSAAFCGVWVWASENLKEIEQARLKFDKLRGVHDMQATRARALSAAASAVIDKRGRSG